MTSVVTKTGLQKCKVLFLDGKGYCILGSDFKEVTPGYFRLPFWKNIVIDSRSFALFKDPRNKAFSMVPKQEFDSQGSLIYALRPLKDEAVETYRKNQTREEKEGTYQHPKVIGEGTYGRVEMYPTERLAVKVSKAEIAVRKDVGDDIVREIAIYRLLSEITCLPRLFEFELDPVKLSFELGDTTLNKAIPGLGKEQKKKVMFRLAKCLRAISSQGVMHLDLKPQNCVLLSNGDIQIIDWGLAEVDKSKGQTRPKNVVVQTLWYRAPEILDYNLVGSRLGHYSHKADIFSLGLMFAEIISGLPEVAGKDDRDQARAYLRIFLDMEKSRVDTVEKIARELHLQITGGDTSKRTEKILIEKEGFDPVLADLLSKMLVFNPRYRIDYDDIVLHPFFQDIRREAIPKLPIFINNMPAIPNIEEEWPNAKYREIIFEWIIEVCEEHKTSLETMCLAFQLMDLFFIKKGKNSIETSQIQLLACSAIALASKLYEFKGIDPDRLSWWSDRTYTPEQVADMTTRLLYTFKGNILIPTLYSYISHKLGSIDNPGGDNYNQLLKNYLEKDVYHEEMPKMFSDLK